jgi:hypothetical protein
MNLNPFTFLRKIFPGFRRDTESANKIDIPRPEKIKRGLRGLRMFRVSRLAGQVQCRCVPENGHTHFCKKHRGYVVDGRLDRATYHRLARSRAVSA